MRIDTEKLLTVKNYALKVGHNRSAIYKQIDAGKLKTVMIDGVIFIKV